MKKYLLAVLALVVVSTTFGQGKYFTKTGKVSFISKASLETIEGKNKASLAVLDTKTGALQFVIPMKAFEFEKALMQEHFNENYVESDKFPKAEFKGAITNNSDINYNKDGTYPAKVKGSLTIHGITKEVEATGTVKVLGGKLFTLSAFNVLISDYNIAIPAVVKDKVSNAVAISVDCNMEPLK